MSQSRAPLRTHVTQHLRDRAMNDVLSMMVSDDLEYQIKYTTGRQVRIPNDRNGTPDFSDSAVEFDASKVELIGTTGWNWKAKRTEFVIFDFDDESHSGGNPLKESDLSEVLGQCDQLGYTTAWHSKGGKGAHVIVAHSMPAATGAEHRQNAIAILTQMSTDASFDFTKYCDASGVVGWIWARDLNATSFQILHKPSRPAPAISRAEQAGDAFEQACSHPRVERDEHHKNCIDLLAKRGFVAIWEEAENRLKTHTKGLAVIHAELGLPGKFTTNTEGLDPGEPNCFAYPRPDGAWFVMRYGTPKETPEWDVRGDSRVSITLHGPTQINGKSDPRSEILAIGRSHELFHTPGQCPVAQLVFGGHARTYLLPDKSYEGVLAEEYHQRSNRVARTSELRDALRLIETSALAGEERPVFVRVGQRDGKVYVDLGDKSLRAVEISADGWRIVDHPPILFFRPDGLGAFPTPERGGKLDALRPFVNVSGDQWPSLVAFLIGAFNPSGPYPLLHLTGQSGTAKTTVARMIKSLVDPFRSGQTEKEEVYSEPKTAEDLMVHATSAWLLPFDNQTKIKDELSDALCRLSTGGVTVKRKLYTDGRVARLKAQRPVLITSIGDIIDREDLRNRTIFIHPPLLTKYTGEAELNQRFDDAWPQIMGALFDAVAQALKAFSETDPVEGNRLVDFTKWAVAAEPVTGLRPGAIRKALTSNRRSAAEEALQTPLAQAIHDFAEPGLTAEPQAILTKLREIGTVDLPDNAISLGRKLGRMASEFRSLGVIIEKRGRKWSIQAEENVALSC